MNTQSMDSDFLRKIDLFSLLSASEAREISTYLKEIQVSANHTLFERGDEGEELFIVKKGQVGGTIQLPNGKKREVAIFNSGDFFGEMAIIENDTRSATCQMRESGSLLTMHKNHFYSLIQERPEIGIKIMYQMLRNTSSRLQSISGFLSDMIRWGNDARKRAITDEYTGCYNRRFMDESLDDYLEAASNCDKPLTIGMVDLDFFRQINEGYSHEMGDKVILAVSRVFKATVRKIDLVARFGGDEFSFIFPYTDKETARQVCEQIRMNVSQLDILAHLDGPVKKVSTSIGLATFPMDANTVEELKLKADEALYMAKESGRNKVFAQGDAKPKKI